jgi:hypothetical protein
VNICLCGTQAGYPHDRLCPYPLFRGSEEQVRGWEEKFQEKCRLTLAPPPSYESAPDREEAK